MSTAVETPAIAARLQAIAVDMSYTIKRTSRSLYVKDGEDFCASVAGLDGLLLAVPDSVGSTLLTIVDCSAAIERVQPLAEGDVIITNDAYSSRGLSTHLPDIHVVAPYFHEGRIVAYGWAFMHCSDIGGRVPSSISPFNTSVFQEGLQIPPMKLVDGGEVNEDVLDMIRRNTRTPEANVADLRAMLAGLRAGQQGVAEIIGRYGADAFLAAQDGIQSGAASYARELVQRLAPGRYSFTDFLDDGAIEPHPVRFTATLDVHDDGRLGIDFTGTDPQLSSAFNIVSDGTPHPMLTGRVRSVLQTLDPRTPVHSGHTRVIELLAPAGTVVNAQYPAALGVRHGSAVRISDVLGGCFAAAAPELMPAAGSGVVVPIVISEQRGHGRSSQVLTRIFGGFGAAHGLDGHDGKDNSYSNLASSPMESSESELRLTVLDYALRADSGGPGRWRGGMGRSLTFRVDADGTQLLGRGLERFVFRPWGLAGGRAAEKMELVVNEGTPEERRLTKIDVLPLRRGDVVTFRSPGGGGFGDPLWRDEDAVLRDVRRGLVSVAAARADYGVAVAAGAEGSGPDATLVIDREATDALRAGRVPDGDGIRRGEVDFGPERTRWDAVFPDEWYERFHARLFALEAALRSEERSRIFSAVLAGLPAGFPATAATPDELDAAAARARELLDDADAAAAGRSEGDGGDAP